MTEETSAAPEGGAIEDHGGELTLQEATALFHQNFADKDFVEPAEEEEPVAEAAEAPAEEKPDSKADEAEVKDEEQETEETPAIEPPRSWTKAEKEAFKEWPREAQEAISRVASTREAEFRRSQNEASESRKQLEAELANAKRARSEYESKQSAYAKNLEQALQQDFGDIKDFNDLRNLQANDPFRFQQWQLRQAEIGQLKAEQAENERRSAAEKQTMRNTYAAEQTKMLTERVPELADTKKNTEMQARAVKMLTDDLGLNMDQLTRWMDSDVGFEILNNAGIQQLIVDRLRLADIKAAPAKAVPKAAPKVQRPGTPRAPGAAQADSVRALEAKLANSGSTADAWALLQAREAARTRRK